MDGWLKSALEYVAQWLDFQMRMSEQPGCGIAIAHRERVVFERAFGHADLSTGETLTLRHRFRIASHSKSFTAAGILKLRERGTLRLDDPVGTFIEGLSPDVSRATIGQLLSHSAGLTRDGSDAEQFNDRRPFLSDEEVMETLQAPPLIETNTRFKYSNIGYALLGKVLEALTGEPYTSWIAREIVAPAGLAETQPDMPLPAAAPFARGHTGKIVTGRRLIVPGDFATRSLAPAGGFVSTAADTACFFAQMSPAAKKSVLSVVSRREMTRRHWRIPGSDIDLYYGLGTMSGSIDGWDWFGHSGGLQGYASHTCAFPDQHLTVSVLTNSIGGWAQPWVAGVVHILQAFKRHGAPSEKVADWNGRWWHIWGAVDLVPLGERVVLAAPGAPAPLQNRSLVRVTSRNWGRLESGDGFGNFGEPVRRVRRKSEQVSELWVGGIKLIPEEVLAAEMQTRYGDDA